MFAGDLPPADVMDLIDRWCSRAQRSRIPGFVKAAATIRKNKDGISAAIERRLSNGRHEGLNNKIRTMTRRAYGFPEPRGRPRPGHAHLRTNDPDPPVSHRSPSTFMTGEPDFVGRSRLSRITWPSSIGVITRRSVASRRM